MRDAIEHFPAGLAKQAPRQALATLGGELGKLAESGIAKKALKTAILEAVRSIG